MHTYQFVSSVDDLLEAEDADVTARTGLRRSLRWAISAFGVTLVAGGILAFVSPGPGCRVVPIMWLSVGAGLLYYFAGASYRKRRLIRKENPPSEEVVWEFHDDHMEVVEVNDRGAIRRDWCELLQFTECARGVLLYFDDGVVNWLPNRVFRDRAGKEGFVEFLRSHEDREDRSSGASA